MRAILVVLAFLLPAIAGAQTQPFPAPLRVTYQLPTTATDGSPLTGALAITRVQIFVSASPIPNDSTMAPTAEITTGLGAPVQSTFTIANGGTIHVRMKACHQYGCAERFSNEATKIATVAPPGETVISEITVGITP